MDLKAIEKIPTQCAWTIGKGITRPDEPPFGCMIWSTEMPADDEPPIAITEGDDLEDVISRAADEARTTMGF